MADPKRKKKEKKKGRSAYKTRSLLLFSLPSIPNSHRWKMEEKKKQNKREKRNRTNTHTHARQSKLM
jgi:hypothetical protein